MTPKLKKLRDGAAQAHRAGELDKAMALYARYLSAQPGDAGVWSNLGVLHRAAGRHKASLRAQARAVALDPGAKGLQNNFANILSDTGDYAASLKIRRSILDQDPDDLNHLAMEARCLRGQGKYADAIACCEAALTRHPDDAELRMQLAFAQLGARDYAAGFENYKARWRAGELKPRELPFPQWNGEDMQGKRLAVLPEQGFGDGVLFSRFTPVLADTGAEVLFVTERPLGRLFEGLKGADQVKVGLDRSDKVDAYVNVMDLAPRHFAQSNEIPVPTTLHIPRESKARAKAILANYTKTFNIGVVWSGSVTYKGNAFRSFSHSDFLPLTDVPGVQLFSLYKGPLVDAYRADGSDAFILDVASTEVDFADCAGLMKELDLVITSDTATAHIAGSLGIPVWVVLHWDPFWVFTHHGDTTPWYPSMRLFRQEKPLEWGGVMDQVKAAVRDAVKER